MFCVIYPPTALRAVPPPDKREGESTAGSAGTEGSVGLPPLHGEGGPAQPVGGGGPSTEVTLDLLENARSTNALSSRHPDLSPRFPPVLFSSLAFTL